MRELKLQALLNIAQIDLRRDFKQILEEILTIAAGAMAARAGSMILVNEETGKLEMVATFGLPDDYIKRVHNRRVPISASPSGMVFETGRYYLVSNIFKEPRDKPWANLGRELDFSAQMFMPLKRKDEVIGIMVIYMAEPHEFTEDEIAFVSIAASQAAAVIENARLYTLERQKKKEREREIAERKRAEEALLESEGIYKAIFENTGTAMTILEDDMTVSYVNDEMEKVAGYSKEEIEGKVKWTEFVVKEDLERMAEYHRLRRIDPEAAPRSYEFQFIHKNGGVRDVSLTAEIIPGTKKSVISLIDITARKQMEEELRQSEATHRIIFESKGVPTVILNEDGTFYRVNAEGAKISGFSKEELEGKKSWTEFIAKKEDLERMREIHRLRRENPDKVPRNYEFLFRDRYGNLRNIYVTAAIIPGTKKSVVSFMDITEIKKAEKKQLELIKELARANKDLSDFASVASHDLKTPLRGISTLAEWISTDYADKLDDAGKKQLDLLRGRVLRMYRLIEDILQYSQVGRLEEEKEAVDLNTLVSEVIDAIESPETVEIEVANQLPTLVCDRTQMGQVFQNLLSNAVKYMDKPEGKVTVGCTQEDGYWKFSVADNGQGIEEKYFEKIFQIFQTLQPRESPESTGVGLTIVKKIAELHGGKVWVESKLGVGSTFFFTVPKVAKDV